MTHRTWADIGATALLTATIIIGTLLSAPLGAGDDPATPATAGDLAIALGQPSELGGCLISAIVQPASDEQGIVAGLWRRIRGKPTEERIILKLKVTKRAGDGGQLPFTLTLERFTMNPLSRVFSPKDKEVIWTMGATALFSEGDTWEQEFEIPLSTAESQPPPEKDAAGKKRLPDIVNYSLTAEHGEQRAGLVSFTAEDLKRPAATEPEDAA
ncbi:MAG: hypothetical protein PVH68_10160 [Armatimonadota bacterium]